jgi:uncharacterized 2Fe-2S/4Fe-4S cluster protein (DUF4445 family)
LIMNNSTSVRVRFLPADQSGTFAAGTSVLDAARHLHVELTAFCGGYGVCARCKVLIQGATPDITAEDRIAISAEELTAGYRLACRVRLQDDCTIILSSAEQPQETDILSDGALRHVALKPSVRTLAFQLAPPALTDNISDEEVLQTIDPGVTIHPRVLPTLADRLRALQFKGNAVAVDGSLIQLQTTDDQAKYGMAVDLGTTTVVCKLVDLNSGKVVATYAQLNRQRPFGEDVIGRIQYAEKGPQECRQLQQAVLDLLNDAVDDMCSKSGVDPQHIYQMMVAGNTVMEHLFLGLDARHLAQMPYIPVFRKAQRRLACELNLKLHPLAEVYLLPIIGRFVGGDTTAVLLSLADRFDHTWLAVDIGTNGEMILHQNGRLWSTSAAAGPAFEGAHISQGMRAGQGAIDRVSVVDGKLHVHVIGDVPAVGICGSGLIDAVGSLLAMHGLNLTGRLQINDKDIFANPENGQGVVHLQAAEGEVLLTQADIREVQLAKSAIATAIQILLKSAGVAADQLDALYLAGAFGQYIRKDMARAIGLLPDIPLQKIHFIGNAAYVGAQLALCSSEERSRAEDLAKSVRYVEVASDPEFQDLFADNCFFPG